MTNRVGVSEVFLAPLVLCSAMLACALTTGEIANVSMRSLIVPYVWTSIIFTALSVMISLFWWVFQLARVGADAPIRTVVSKLRERAPFMLLSAAVFPIFLASFTATKSAIPFLVGYTWDPFWAHVDRFIFGDDVWRIAHHWLGNAATRPFEWFYVAVWAPTLVFSMALIPLNATARFTAKFYTAMMATWFVGGFVLAYVLSAAGPVFAHLVSSDPTVQFADLRGVLNATLVPHGPIQTGQMLLPATMSSHVAVVGGGVSAMPSMHLGVVSIYVIAARRTRWLIPSVAMWAIIFVASGYFGYHYWIDGIVAAAVATVSWCAAEMLYSGKRRLRLTSLGEPQLGSAF
ncbi:MAG TPA: phosphatase PAP2 family protein [Sphingomicrobium sp.]|nr:phosphatase PAP2 family protein [Sphingomicrobium sp.]